MAIHCRVHVHIRFHFYVHVHIRVRFYVHVHVHFRVHVPLLRMRAHRIVAALTRRVQARKPRPQIPTARAIALAIVGTFSGGLTLDLVLRNCGPATHSGDIFGRVNTGFGIAQLP